MMISTKGRYALRVMVDLAEHREEGYIPLRTVAQRQGISQKYLESIMTTLSKAGFVDGTHGRGGGYRLVRSPEEYHIGPLLRAIEGPLAPVQCVEDAAQPCEMGGRVPHPCVVAGAGSGDPGLSGQRHAGPADGGGKRRSFFGTNGEIN